MRLFLPTLHGPVFSLAFLSGVLKKAPVLFKHC